MTYRDRLIAYVKEEYGADPEYLWAKFPDYFIFRHASNRKWFGLVMNVRRKNLGLDGDGEVDVLNVKLSDKFLAEMLIRQPGFVKGYHSGGGNWISILLEGTVDFEEICRWLEESHITTAPKIKSAKASNQKEVNMPAAKKTTTAKKATTKKPAAKKTTTAKKTTAAKKPAAKKATTAKKTTAKKPAAKKTAAKKTASKKTTAKKTTAKKTTTAKKQPSKANLEQSVKTLLSKTVKQAAKGKSKEEILDVLKEDIKKEAKKFGLGK